MDSKTLAAFVWMRFGSIVSADLPQMHLISACDRILATNGELLRRAEKRLSELQGQDAATVLLSSQQAVLDLVISIGGSPDVLDAAQGEELLHALTASAEERGRLEEQQKSRSERSKLRAIISEKDRIAQEKSAQAVELTAAVLKRESQIRRQKQELDSLIREQTDRVNIRVDLYISQSERIAWYVITIACSLAAIFGLFGHLFIWEGVTWWTTSVYNVFFGAGIIICNLFVLALGLRWVPPRRIDLAAEMQRRLSRAIVRMQLGRVESGDELDRVVHVLSERKFFEQ